LLAHAPNTSAQTGTLHQIAWLGMLFELWPNPDATQKGLQNGTNINKTQHKHKPHKKHKSWKCVSPRIKGSNHYLYGKKQTQEHIQKRSKKRPEGTGKKISEKLKGKKHTQETKSKISQKNSVAVIQLDKMGNFIKEWNSMSEVERILGLSKRNISNTCSGRQSTSGGFIWKYKFS
jgi:hypothetical protein